MAALPREAVQTIEGTDAVFLPGDELGEFVPWPVQLGAELPGGLVEIVAGLSPGDEVVVAGAFTLKAELFKSEFGGHGHGD